LELKIIPWQNGPPLKVQLEPVVPVPAPEKMKKYIIAIIAATISIAQLYVSR
jgi:hypothetical protein